MNITQEKTSLSADLLRSLKKSAHHLNAVIQFGKKGVNEALLNEINNAIGHHELIKMRVAKDQKEAFKVGLPTILEHCCAQHISTIGNVVILFKKKETDSQYDM